jgi:hypothetical protein
VGREGQRSLAEWLRLVCSFLQPWGNVYEALELELIARFRRKTEDRINSFRNYKTFVTGADGEQYEIHFLALQSQKADAIPIVLLHGWPGKVRSKHSRRNPAQMWCQRQVALSNSSTYSIWPKPNTPVLIYLTLSLFHHCRDTASRVSFLLKHAVHVSPWRLRLINSWSALALATDMLLKVVT